MYCAHYELTINYQSQTILRSSLMAVLVTNLGWANRPIPSITGF